MRACNRLTTSGEATGRYVRQSAGPGTYGVVTLRLDPLDADEPRLVVASALPEGDPVAGVLGAIALGAQDAAYVASLVGVRVTVLGGRWHEVDSNPRSFRTAARLACESVFADRGLTPIEIPEARFPSVRTVTRRAQATVAGATLAAEATGESRDLDPVWATARWATLDPAAQVGADAVVAGLARVAPPWADLRLVLLAGVDRGEGAGEGAIGAAARAALDTAAPIERGRCGPGLVFERA
jgi:hypothetical protein